MQATDRIAILTSGGFAPCLSSAVAALISEYSATAPDLPIIAYRHGYEGLLRGDYFTVGPEERAGIDVLFGFGGSPLGSSRVKLTNMADLVQRGLVAVGADPLESAARRLAEDGVSVLHTIGGDDTNTTAADLSAFLASNGYQLTVVGLPKTIDNDVSPIIQTLGASTAADAGAMFASHVVAEHNFMPKMLIVHEIMGRNCGWLTAETARRYRTWLDGRQWLPGIGLSRAAWDVHAVYVPEMPVNLSCEAERLRTLIDTQGCATIFLSEGAGQREIIHEVEAAGAQLPRDAFGHVLLDTVNSGQWFGKQLAERIGANRVFVQKSGFYARSAPSNAEDLDLIRRSCHLAMRFGLQAESGVVGLDGTAGGKLGLIPFTAIGGGKPFDITQPWFQQLLGDIGQVTI